MCGNLGSGGSDGVMVLLIAAWLVDGSSLLAGFMSFLGSSR